MLPLAQIPYVPSLCLHPRAVVCKRESRTCIFNAAAPKKAEGEENAASPWRGPCGPTWRVDGRAGLAWLAPLLSEWLRALAPICLCLAGHKTIILLPLAPCAELWFSWDAPARPNAWNALKYVPFRRPT